MRFLCHKRVYLLRNKSRYYWGAGWAQERLKKHNAGRGGERTKKGAGSWGIVLEVYGFRTASEVLAFEYRLQNPAKSFELQFKHVKHTVQGRLLHGP